MFWNNNKNDGDELEQRVYQVLEENRNLMREVSERAVADTNQTLDLINDIQVEDFEDKLDDRYTY